MTTFDWVLNIALIGLVLRQMRGRRLDRRGLLMPVALVLWAATQYLHGIPTAGNDLVLVTVAITAGLMLGTASGLLTRIEAGASGVAVARATVAVALLLVVGISARMGFALYVQHGGAPTVTRFSIAHHLTATGWVTALVLMAFVEVLSRTFVLWTRSRAVLGSAPRALAIS
jgi:hypothetical protein